MKIIENYKYLLNTGEVTGEMKSTDKKRWFDTKNDELFNADGINLVYKRKFVQNKSKFIVHQNYWEDTFLDDEPEIDCSECTNYRSTFKETKTNPYIENIIIYHEFLLEHDENYTGYASELLSSNYYTTYVRDVQGLFLNIFSDYISFITKNNFELVLSEHLTDYLSNINDKDDAIKETINTFYSNRNNVKVNGVGILNSLDINTDNLKFKVIKSQDELNNFFKNELGVNVNQTFEKSNKREFDSEYYFDVLDKIEIIRILKRKILKELNIKIILLNASGTKLKNIYDLPYLENTYERLKNIYETSLISTQKTYIEIKTDKYFK